MIKLKDIFEAKISGAPSPLVEAQNKALLSSFETAISDLVKRGKDFATVTMIQTAMRNLSKTEVNGADVAALAKQHLEAAVGKQGYYDLASYGMK